MHKSFIHATGGIMALAFVQSADAQQISASAIAPFIKATPYPTADVDMSKDADLKRCAMKTLIKLAPAGSEFLYRKHESGTSFFSVLESNGMHHERNIYIKDGKSGPGTLQTGTYSILKKDYDAKIVEEDLSIAVNGNKGILTQAPIVDDSSAYAPERNNQNYIHPGTNAAVKLSMQMYREMVLCMPKLLG